MDQSIELQPTKKNKLFNKKSANTISYSEYLMLDFNQEFIKRGTNDRVINWEMYRSVLYSPTSGQFYKYTLIENEQYNKDDPSSKKYLINSLYKIFPSDVFMINVFNNYTGKSTFKKPNILAWEIMNHRVVKREEYVFPRDLNINNLVGSNIGISSRAEYKVLRDALANHKGALKLTVMGNEKFKVYYRQNKRLLSQTFFDEIEAKAFFREKKLECHKLLSSFHITG